MSKQADIHWLDNTRAVWQLDKQPDIERPYYDLPVLKVNGIVETVKGFLEKHSPIIPGTEIQRDCPECGGEGKSEDENNFEWPCTDCGGDVDFGVPEPVRNWGSGQQTLVCKTAEVKQADHFYLSDIPIFSWHKSIGFPDYIGFGEFEARDREANK